MWYFLGVALFVELLRGFNRVTREALTRILGAPIDDTTFLQAKLPTNLGGMGLRTAEDHAPAAFAASRLSSQPILLSLKEGQPQQQPVGEGDQQEPILQPPLLEGEKCKSAQVKSAQSPRSCFACFSMF